MGGGCPLPLTPAINAHVFGRVELKLEGQIDRVTFTPPPSLLKCVITQSE